MSESKPKDFAAWIWVTVVVAIIGCLGLLACAGLISASLMLPELIKASPTQPDLTVSDTPIPVPSNTSAPTITAIPGGPAPLQDSDYVGLWQYPDRWVWIKITPQGQAFQCRIAKDRTVFRSEGTLIEGDKIIWQEIWGVDSIRRDANSIILNGKYGEFEYELTDNEMDPACESPF